jgi:putative ABC transport system permease protein
VSTIYPLYVATPSVLSHYGIREAEINTASDIISARSDLRGLQILAPELGVEAATRGPANSPRIAQPTIQTFKQLPNYGSDPGTLITPRAMQALGLRPIPSGWLLQTDHPLSTAEIITARQAAGSVGLYLETRHAQKSLAPLRIGPRRRESCWRSAYWP